MTLSAVLNISNNLSTPTINEIASKGMPTEVNTTVIITNATDGTPAAPILPIVAVIKISKYSSNDKLRPIRLETKTADSPKYIADPSMFTVAPIGITKLQILLSILRFFSAVFRVRGIVAELLDDTNAKKIVFFIFLKNL